MITREWLLAVMLAACTSGSGAVGVVGAPSGETCSIDDDCPEALCDPARGVCVDCRQPSDCDASAPVCVPTGECEPRCTMPTDCGDSEVCHPTLGACVECAADSDCPSEMRRCSPYLECVECLTSLDCSPTESVCIDGACETPN